jgi:hypothetical protein
MVRERRFELRPNGIGQAGIADEDQGFEGMAKATQVFFLGFGKRHGRGV